MDDEASKKFYAGLREASARVNERKECANRYFPTSSGIAYFFLMKLSKEKIEEIGKNYEGKEYQPNELLDELIEACGYNNDPLRNFLYDINQFTLTDLRTLAYHVNDKGRRESDYWISKYKEIQAQLIGLGEKLGNKISKQSVEMRDLRQTIRNLERFRKFDRTTYDPKIFDAATIRYKHAPKLHKNYGICLFMELKERGLAKDGFEETEEFWDRNKAYKTYRSKKKKVRSSLPKK